MSRKLLWFAAIAILSAMVLGVPGHASAQTGFNVSIFPAKVELTVAQETTQYFGVNLHNFGTEAQTLKVYFNDYMIKANNDFVFQQPGHYSYSCAKWLTAASNTMVVPPGQVGTLAFSITVPQKAEPGGHYAVIFFEQVPPANAAQVKARPRLGSLVLVTVPGTIVRVGRIKKVTVSSSWFWPSVDVPVLPSSHSKARVEFYNAGNVHLTIRGRLTYKSTFGWGKGVVGLGEITVLPKTTRYLDADLSQKPQVNQGNPNQPQMSVPGPEPGSTRPVMGSYKVVATVEYGPAIDVYDTKKTATTSFSNYPLSYLVVLLILVGIIIGLVFLRKWWRARSKAKKEGEDTGTEDKDVKEEEGSSGEDVEKKAEQEKVPGEDSGSGEGD